MTIVIPNGDEKEIDIYYTGRVYGANGTNVTYTNTVQILGRDENDSVNSTIYMQSTGSGEGSLISINLKKYVYGNMAVPLEGDMIL